MQGPDKVARQQVVLGYCEIKHIEPMLLISQMQKLGEGTPLKPQLVHFGTSFHSCFIKEIMSVILDALI